MSKTRFEGRQVILKNWTLMIPGSETLTYIYQGLFCHDQVSSGKILTFFILWRNLQMFLDTMETRTENKNLSLE